MGQSLCDPFSSHRQPSGSPCDIGAVTTAPFPDPQPRPSDAGFHFSMGHKTATQTPSLVVGGFYCPHIPPLQRGMSGSSQWGAGTSSGTFSRPSPFSCPPLGAAQMEAGGGGGVGRDVMAIYNFLRWPLQNTWKLLKMAVDMFSSRVCHRDLQWGGWRLERGTPPWRRNITRLPHNQQQTQLIRTSLSKSYPLPRPSLFCDTGGGGGSWRRQALFQGRHCFLSYPYPRGGGVQSRRQAPTHRLVHL